MPGGRPGSAPVSRGEHPDHFNSREAKELPGGAALRRRDIFKRSPRPWSLFSLPFAPDLGGVILIFIKRG